jgi:hypothetical protein
MTKYICYILECSSMHCGVVKVYKRFARTHCFHLRCYRLNHARNQQRAGLLSYSATLKMETERSSELQVNVCQNTRSYTLKHGTLYSHLWMILKSSILWKNVYVVKGINLGMPNYWNRVQWIESKNQVKLSEYHNLSVITVGAVCRYESYYGMTTKMTCR